MIETMDIVNTINQQMVALFSDAEAHIQPSAEDFNRPAYLIEVVRVTPRQSTKNTVHMTVYLTITYFVSVDDRQHSSAEDLFSAQDNIMSIFRPGYISVKDRKIKAQSSDGGKTFDEAYVDVQLEYFDDRAEAADDDYPLMGEVKVNITQEG